MIVLRAIQVDTPANTEFKFLAYYPPSIMGVPAAARSGAVSSYSGVASPCRFRPAWQVTMSSPAIRVADIHGEESSAIST